MLMLFIVVLGARASRSEVFGGVVNGERDGVGDGVVQLWCWACEG